MEIGDESGRKYKANAARQTRQRVAHLTSEHAYEIESDTAVGSALQSAARKSRPEGKADER